MELHQHIINIRKDKKLKLPDAIIVGCSEYRKCTLITADKKILKITYLSWHIKLFKILIFLLAEAVTNQKYTFSESNLNTALFIATK